jgi:hypothetical protein
VTIGAEESEDSWSELLAQLNERGLSGVQLATWRCAVCGCTAVEAGERTARRGCALLARAVTCGETACQRARQRQRMREKFGPGTAYYRRAQKRQKAARKAQRRRRRPER